MALTAPLHLLVACALAAATPPSPAALALQAALDAAVASGASSFGLPAGDVFFNDASFNITNASAIDIFGGVGTTLWFGPGFGVAVANSTNSTLRDFVIDYSPLPYVHGVITAQSASTITVSLSPTSMTFETLASDYPPHDTWPPVSVFDSRTSDLVGSVCSWGVPAPATRISPGVYSIACRPGGAKLGDVLVAATRVGLTLSLSRTAEMVTRNVTLHAASYMAITEFLGDGGNTYDHVAVVPRNASTPLGSNADGFHSSGMRRGPQLVGVSIHNLLDDYFNVHNTFQLLVAGATPASPASILLGDYQLFAGGNTLYGTQQTLEHTVPGDGLSFYPLNVFSWPALAASRIATITRVPDAIAAPLLQAAYSNASAVAKSTPCSACHAGLNPFATAQLYNVTLVDSLPPSLTPPLFVNSDEYSAIDSTISGCSFSGSASNLGRFKSSGGSITGTLFRNTLSQNLEIEPLQNWLEGALGLHNVTIANNVFHGTTSSPIHTFGAADVTSTNNTFMAAAR